MDILWVDDDDDDDEACARWSRCCVDDMARRRERVCVLGNRMGAALLSVVVPVFSSLFTVVLSVSRFEEQRAGGEEWQKDGWGGHR